MSVEFKLSDYYEKGKIGKKGFQATEISKDTIVGKVLEREPNAPNFQEKQGTASIQGTKGNGPTGFSQETDYDNFIAEKKLEIDFIRGSIHGVANIQDTIGKLRKEYNSSQYKKNVKDFSKDWNKLRNKAPDLIQLYENIAQVNSINNQSSWEDIHSVLDVNHIKEDIWKNVPENISNEQEYMSLEGNKKFRDLVNKNLKSTDKDKENSHKKVEQNRINLEKKIKDVETASDKKRSKANKEYETSMLEFMKSSNEYKKLQKQSQTAHDIKEQYDKKVQLGEKYKKYLEVYNQINKTIQNHSSKMDKELKDVHFDEKLRIWSEGKSQNMNVGNWYNSTNISTLITNEARINLLDELVNPANAHELLKLNSHLALALENSKKSRDIAEVSKSTQTNTNLKDKNIYFLNVGKRTIPCYMENDKKDINFFDSDAIKGLSKSELKELNEEKEKIKLENDLANRMDKAELSKKLNIEVLTNYLAFDENEVKEKMQNGQIDENTQINDLVNGENFDSTKEVEWEDLVNNTSDTVFNVRDIIDGFSDKENIKQYKAWKNNETYKRPDEKIGTKDRAFAALDVAKDTYTLVMTIKEIIDNNNDAKHALEIGDKSEYYLKTFDKYVSAFKAVTTLGSTGIDSLPLMNISKDIVGCAGDVLNIISGAVDTVSGIAHIGFAIHNLNRINKSMDTLKQNHEERFDEKGKLKEQASVDDTLAKMIRIEHYAKTAQRQNAANAALDTFTGAASMVSGFVSIFVPGIGSAIGAAIGLASTLIGYFGKMIISSIFRGKQRQQAWCDLLHYDKDEYNKIDPVNFRNALRKKTGVNSKSKYIDALGVTDAIDMYLMSQTYPVSSESQKKDVSTVLGGLGYGEPEKYPNLTLGDILPKLNVENDWKGTLKSAITDNGDREIKEDKKLA